MSLPPRTEAFQSDREAERWCLEFGDLALYHYPLGSPANSSHVPPDTTRQSEKRHNHPHPGEIATLGRGAGLRDRLPAETAKENGCEHTVHVTTPDGRWDSSAHPISVKDDQTSELCSARRRMKP
jgi:hypothetical protein